MNAFEGDVGVALGTLLLAEMLLAHEDIVAELTTTLQTLMCSEEDIALVTSVTSSIEFSNSQYLHEVSTYAQWAGDWTESVVQQAALLAISGTTQARTFLEPAIHTRHAQGYATRDIASLIKAWSNCEAYMVVSSQHCVSSIYRTRKLPVEGFTWLWKLIESKLCEMPGSFHVVTDGMMRFQCLEFHADVPLVSHGYRAPTGTFRLYQYVEQQSKAAVRNAYAAFLFLGLRMWAKNLLSSEDFLAALRCGFECGRHPSGHGCRGCRFHCSNMLGFLQRPDTEKNVEGLIVLRTILSNVNDDLRASIMSMMRNFPSWEVVFCPIVVRNLSVMQQLMCITAFTASWLSGPICTSLRGEARNAAFQKLAENLEVLSTDQWAFLAKATSMKKLAGKVQICSKEVQSKCRSGSRK
jgi:hypothetical protein